MNELSHAESTGMPGWCHLCHTRWPCAFEDWRQEANEQRERADRLEADLAAARAEVAALREAPRALLDMLDDWHRLIGEIVQDGDPKSHVGRLEVRDFRELFARQRDLRRALARLERGTGVEG